MRRAETRRNGCTPADGCRSAPDGQAALPASRLRQRRCDTGDRPLWTVCPRACPPTAAFGVTYAAVSSLAAPRGFDVVDADLFGVDDELAFGCVLGDPPVCGGSDVVGHLEDGVSAD